MNNSEQFRLECEARFYLHEAKFWPDRITTQITILEKKRGRPQTRLLNEMRRQWKIFQHDKESHEATP